MMAASYRNAAAQRHLGRLCLRRTHAVPPNTPLAWHMVVTGTSVIWRDQKELSWRVLAFTLGLLWHGEIIRAAAPNAARAKNAHPIACGQACGGVTLNL